MFRFSICCILFCVCFLLCGSNFVMGPLNYSPTLRLQLFCFILTVIPLYKKVKLHACNLLPTYMYENNFSSLSPLWRPCDLLNRLCPLFILLCIQFDIKKTCRMNLHNGLRTKQRYLCTICLINALHLKTFYI